MVLTLIEEPTAEQLKAATALRYRVFVDEQRVPLEIEQDGLDAIATHVVVVDADVCVGTGRFLAGDDGATFKVQRVAVDAGWRGRGVGRMIMDGLEARARSAGRTRALLASQASAVGFYEALGYRQFGAMFMEAGIEHVWMDKRV